MDLRIGKFKTKDGTKLYYEHWTPEGFKRVMVLVHGLGDHCGRYRSLVHYFTNRGYRLCVFDLRGHGQSGGKRVYVRHFEKYCEDLESFCKFSLEGMRMNLGWYLVGHSMGGQIILNYLSTHPNFFKAACATSPNLEVALTMPAWLEKMGKVLLYLWPTMKLKGLTKPELLSHDPKVIETYIHDPLTHPYVSIRLGSEILKNLERLFSTPSRIQNPLLMLHGSEDRYCSPNGTKRFFNELTLAEKQLKIYDGCYHELLNEIEKEKVFKDIERWFEIFS